MAKQTGWLCRCLLGVGLAWPAGVWAQPPAPGPAEQYLPPPTVHGPAVPGPDAGPPVYGEPCFGYPVACCGKKCGKKHHGPPCGCCNKDCWCVDNCATIPYGAQPAPPGTYVNRWLATQSTKAEEDDFVIYRHMWHRGGHELGPLGRYQLDMIAKRMIKQPFPVIIETSKDDCLDATRRELIVVKLAHYGVNDPSRVIVAFPAAEGLYGDEAPRIYNGILGLGLFGQGGGPFNTFNQGNFFPGGGGFGGLGGLGFIP